MTFRRAPEIAHWIEDVDKLAHTRRTYTPSAEFFRSLQEAMDRDPTCTEHLEPSEAYCGLAIDQRLFVLEFDGRRCAGIAPSGNELDLDFVVAGPAEVWRQTPRSARRSEREHRCCTAIARGKGSARDPFRRRRGPGNGALRFPSSRCSWSRLEVST
jgi:hypothetical protein